MAESLAIGGRYQVEDLEKALLGEGGMGKVYLGEDTESGQKVAIKTLRRERFDNKPEALERFRREGELLRQLDHPNIVKMLEAIEEGGQHYLVMEYVEGGDLNDRLAKDGKPSIEETLAISLELADALTRAHHLNVIHRDIKPANVLIAPDHTPRLTDFGISHYSDQERLTVEGGLVGTIPYLSPEGCTGRGLDPRADIWSFGVLLYELLTGELPFRGEDAVATITAILQHELPDMQRVNGEIPDGVADLVGRMLVKDAEGRMPSMRLVGAEIEGLIKGYEYTPASPRGKKLLDSVHADTSTFATPELDTEEKKVNLPVQATRFIGREKELNEIIELLSHPEGRLVTLLGPGGMGKTRLGIEGARRVAPAFEHGVHFVDLAPIVEPERIPQAIAQALGLNLMQELDPVEQLAFYFRDKKLLLVMDNYEHVIHGSAMLKEILGKSSGVRVMATSRVRLNLQEERVYEVKGMISPADEGEVVFEEIEAVELFIQQARRQRPDFRLAEDDKAAVVQVCQLAGGVPLAIQLAAGWVHTLPPKEIAEELAGDVDFLESEMQDLPERQRSMRAVFDYSWKLLPEKLRDSFIRLSVFRGGFTREAAKEVAGAGVRDLADLVTQSLLQRGEDGRFSVHELMRQIAKEKLEKSGELEKIRELHARYFIERMGELLPALQGRDQLGAMSSIDSEYENMRSAWSWTLDNGEIERLEKPADTLFLFSNYRGQADVRGLFEQAAKHFSQQKIDYSLTEIKINVYLKNFPATNFPEFCDYIEKAETAAAKRKDELALAYIHWGKAMCAFDRHEGFGVTKNDQISMEKFRQQGDKFMEKMQIFWSGASMHEMGDEEGGNALMDEYFRATRELGDRYGEAWGLGMSGTRRFNEGRFQEAEELLREAIALSEALDSRNNQAYFTFWLAWLLEIEGKLDEALRLAALCVQKGKEYNFPGIIAAGWVVQGAASLRKDEYTQAVKLLDESQTIFHFNLIDLLANLGRSICYSLMGEGKKSQKNMQQYFQHAISEIDRVFGMLPWICWCGEEGRWEEAVEAISVVHAYRWTFPRQSLENYTWYKRLMPKLKEELTEEAYAAAWERGKTLEVDKIVERILEEGKA